LGSVPRGESTSSNAASRPGGIPEVLGVTVRLTSDGELSRLKVLRNLDQKRLTTEAAAASPSVIGGPGSDFTRVYISM
jgi:hypothetical protein